jgi:hypothetical protein
MEKYCPCETANAIMDLKKTHCVNDYALIRYWMSNLDGNAFWTVHETIRAFNDKDAEALLDSAITTDWAPLEFEQ